PLPSLPLSPPFPYTTLFRSPMRPRIAASLTTLCRGDPMSSQPLSIFWFLPTHGDSRFLGTDKGARPVDLPYLQQIAQAADSLGYEGVLIPTGRSSEDAWLAPASPVARPQRLNFLVALPPGVISPTVAARQAATLARLSGGRALFNLVTGGNSEEPRGDGVRLAHAERYEAAAKFTRIWRHV